MSLWSLIKIVAALCVIGIMIFTGMLAYHVSVAPLGGIFRKIIPNPVNHAESHTTNADVAKMLDSAEMPDIDPGEKAFQKAHELLALGRLAEAREKLTNIIDVFPTSSSAPAARRIIGEMNLDEILSSSHMEGKQLHTVKRGDSLFGIASKYKTTIDCMMALNSMMELRGLQPGDELVVMPLEFRLLIEPKRKALSLWDGTRFIREYQVLHFGGVPAQPLHTAISSESAEIDGRRVPPQSKEFRSAAKFIHISKPSIQIRAWDGAGDRPPAGILLQPQDMEELSLLTRVGNDVEIR